MTAGVATERWLARRRLRPAVALVAGAWLLVPFVPLVLWSVAERWAFPAALPTQWGLRGWQQALADGVVPALLRSLLLAVLVAVLATPAGALAGRALATHRVPGARVIAVLLLLPVAVPPFAVVMGLSTVALRLQVPSTVAVVVVLGVAAIPYTTFVMWSAYAAYDEAFGDEARTLGASRRHVLLRVHVPLMAPALAASTFLAFLVGWSDYVVTLVLGGGMLVTLPMLVGALASGSGNDAAVASASLVGVVPPLVLLALTAALAARGGLR